MKKKELLIGTRNFAKYQRWSLLFPDRPVLSLNDIAIQVSILEENNSIQKNAERKAITYAEKSQIITLSDDTSLCIEELNGMPGISVKTWGGKFELGLTDEQLLHVIKKYVLPLENSRSYLETAISIATPNGVVKTFFASNKGYIDKERLQKPYIKGYPLSCAFVSDRMKKTWYEMTDKERYLQYYEINSEIVKYIQTLDCL